MLVRSEEVALKIFFKGLQDFNVMFVPNSEEVFSPKNPTIRKIIKIIL